MMNISQTFEIPRERRQTNYFNLVEGGTQRYLDRCNIKRLLRPVYEYCISIGLKLDKIVISEAENNHINLENVQLEINASRNVIAEQPFDKKVKAFKALIGKDEGNFSDKAYKIFRKNVNFITLPTIDEIVDVRHEIDEKLFPIHENTVKNGFYNEPLDKIKKICTQFVRNQNGSIYNDTIVLKLGGDGTSLTKSNTKILNLAFTVINDFGNAKSVKGNYCLGAFEIETENYENLKSSMEEILAKIKQIQNHQINIDGRDYTIKFMLGGDLKFIALVFGINAANSHHCCPWCYFDSSQPVDINETFLSRTQELAEEFSQYGTELMGHIHKPIIDFIEFDCCVIDSLHLLLRISDKLFEALIDKINTIDNHPESINWEDRPLLKRFNDALKQKCKIYKPFYISSQKGAVPAQIKLRSLSGSDRLKIFESFCGGQNMLRDIFPADLIDLNIEEYAWSKFYESYEQIKEFSSNPNNNNPQNSIESLKSTLKEWLGFYMMLIGNNISPYAHALVWHVPEFLEKYGEISIFNMQGHEKLNDFYTVYYHRSSNRKRQNNAYLKQIINKRNRIEFYSLGGSILDFNEDQQLDN